MPDSFKLTSSQFLNNFGEISNPDLIAVRPFEKLNCLLIDPKTLLIEAIALQKLAEVKNDLWRSYLDIKDLLVHLLCFFESSIILKEVQVQRLSTQVVT